MKESKKGLTHLDASLQKHLAQSPETPSSPEVISAQDLFARLVRETMTQSAQHWEFDQYEFKRILSLTDDEVLRGLLEFLIDLSTEWSTVEDFEQWCQIHETVLARLQELDLFQKLGISLLSAPPSLNGKPTIQ